MSKKIISGMMALILAFSLVACDKDEDSKKSEKSKADSSSSEVETTKETKEEKEEETEKEKETEKDSKSDTNAKFSADGTYTSANGYSMKLPAGWTEARTSTNSDVLSDSSGNQFSFISSPSDEDFETADEAYFRNNYLQAMGAGDSIKMVSYEEVKIDGNKAHILELSVESGETTPIIMQAFIAVNDEVYMFFYTDIDGSKPEVFDNAMDSLTIID